MQITIDTSNMMGDESTIRDEVIEQVIANLTRSFQSTLDIKIKEVFDKEISVLVAQTVSEIVTTHIDTEITTVEEYGKQHQPESIRTKISNHLTKLCTFKDNNSFSSSNNSFTNIVKKTVEDELRKFQKEYISTVDRKVAEQSLDAATKLLKKSLGIK